MSICGSFGPLRRKLTIFLLGVGFALCFSNPRKEPGNPAAIDKRENEATFRRNLDELLKLRQDQERQRTRRDSIFRESLTARTSEDGCVAYETVQSRCLITVEAYNSGIAELAVPSNEEQVPSKQQIDSLRNSLLKGLLEPRYWEHWADSAGKAEEVKDLAARFPQKEIDNLIGKQELGELKRLYQSRYDEWFSGRRIPHVLAIGATDSLLLDSAWHGRGAKFIWHKLPAEEIPAGVRMRLDTLLPGGIIGPIRFSFGFLFLKLAYWENRPDIPFEKAIPVLMRIRFLESSGGSKSSRQKDDPKPRKGTGIGLRVWSVPSASLAWKEENPFKRKFTRSGFDTGSVRPLRMTSSDLPGGICDWVDAELGPRNHWVLGPKPMAFGIWYFKREDVNRTKSPLPIQAAKPVHCRDSVEETGSVIEEAIRMVREKDDAIHSRITREIFDSLNKAEMGSANAPMRPGWEAEMMNWLHDRIRVTF